jgi:hypothetical protein
MDTTISEILLWHDCHQNLHLFLSGERTSFVDRARDREKCEIAAGGGSGFIQRHETPVHAVDGHRVRLHSCNFFALWRLGFIIVEIGESFLYHIQYCMSRLSDGVYVIPKRQHAARTGPSVYLIANLADLHSETTYEWEHNGDVRTCFGL